MLAKTEQALDAACWQLTREGCVGTCWDFPTRMEMQIRAGTNHNDLHRFAQDSGCLEAFHGRFGDGGWGVSAWAGPSSAGLQATRNQRHRSMQVPS